VKICGVNSMEMMMNKTYLVVAVLQLEALIAGMEMGSEIPVQLSELKGLLVILNRAAE